MIRLFSLPILSACLIYLCKASPTTPPDQYSIVLNKGNETINNSAILVGPTNSSLTPISASSGEVTILNLNSQVLQVDINSNAPFIGARFNTLSDQLYYGVWEYPFSGSLTNTNISFEIKGVGNGVGINWSNARAPFFISTAGYGVYVDTLKMGTFDFTIPGQVEFNFNTGRLKYYIIQAKSLGDFKSIIQEYTALSARIEMPPDSGYGPEFWSDDFEEDFHGSVSNAQENYYDVINHLYYNKIRATSMFADRPYGTGNSSFGNFDFDPFFYPTPREFIANLSKFGFDFQVWVANRAFLDTQLYNESVSKGWLFPGIDPIQFLGPALNLSIPAAYNYFKERLSYFTDLGVKGYKIDRGEEGEMPESQQNIQATIFDRLCYESMISKWGVSSFYNFARNAVDRSRSRTYVWNGDSHSNFTGLHYTVTSGIRAGLLGFSQWASDTGGYVRGVNDPSEELWARWMHFSTFSPSYEIMVGTNHTPWYPPYTQRLLNILQQTAQLHTELIPYIKSYTYKATQIGLPVIRALFLEYPDDKASYEITDTYAFGSEFLVAPIVNSGGRRDVYFPTGSSYLEYFNKTEVFSGGKTHCVSLDWENVPVYVREGAIITRGDIFQGNHKWAPWKPWLRIEVFPSFNVNHTQFDYYSGEENGVAEIRMETDKNMGRVRVTYDSLGTEGTLVLFGKGRNYTYELEHGGGDVLINAFQSLF